MSSSAIDCFDYATTAWVAAVRDLATQLVVGKDLTGLSFTMCEELTDPPPDRPLTTSGTIGWWLGIRDGRVETGDQPLEKADIRVVADYATHHDLSRRIWAGNPDAIANSKALRERAVSEGKLRIDGNLSTAPPLILELVHELHDRVAAITK